MHLIKKPYWLWVFCSVVFLFFLCEMGTSQERPAFSAAQIDFFENKVRPILVDHCLECHGAKKGKLRGGLRLTSRQEILEGGDSGSGAVPGNPDESLLMSAVLYDDFEMPPSGQLPAEEIEVLAEWIRTGLPDPREGNPDRGKEVFDMAASRDHWAFQSRSHSEFPHQSIDKWIGDGLKSSVDLHSGSKTLRPLEANVSADRETLIRRLHLTLVGLPPSIAEIDSFSTVEKRVDELLESPHFGERWGRHWLDVARFAESSGGGRSLMFPNAWRYRDYVIDAFNKDKPFDQFIREQIAGDLLPAETQEQRNEQIVATGFLALGPTNYEQQDKEGLVIDVVDEQIDTVGRTFMGLTLGCARCHDHKFDPITTRDYYALAGIFKSTQTVVHSNVSKYVETSIASSRLRELQEEYRQSVKQLTSELAEAKARATSLGGPISGAADSKKSRPVSSFSGLTIDDANAERIGRWQESTFAGPFVGKHYIHDQDAEKGSKKIIFTPQFKMGGEYEVRMSYTSGGNRASNVPILIDHQDGQTLRRVNQSQTPPIDELFISLGCYRFEADNVARVTIETEGTDGHVIVDAVQFIPVVADAAGVPHRVAAVAGDPLADDPSGLVQDQSIKVALRKYRQIEAQLKALKANPPEPAPVAMSVRDVEEPKDSPIHIRGEVRNLGEVVPRGFIELFMPVSAAGNEPNDLAGRRAPKTRTSAKIPADQSGRLQLADWLADPDHPLTARVYVNRVWRHLFGSGLVETTDNFGLMGSPPANEELLDFLADQFVKNGWSTKTLIRQIVTTKTYQQRVARGINEQPGYESANQVMKADDRNRLLWRFNRQRLDVEVLRDSILAVSGQLDLTAGGMTIRKISQYDLGYEFNTQRRSVYVPAFRNAMLDMFEVFDLANPNLVTGNRVTSTLPTQSLFLMNSPMVIQSARVMAGKILEEESAGDNDEQRTQRIITIYRTLLGRFPSDSEVVTSIGFLDEFIPDADSQTAELDAFQNLIHALFCSLEFRFMD